MPDGISEVVEIVHRAGGVGKNCPYDRRADGIVNTLADNADGTGHQSFRTWIGLHDINNYRNEQIFMRFNISFKNGYKSRARVEQLPGYQATLAGHPSPAVPALQAMEHGPDKYPELLLRVDFNIHVRGRRKTGKTRIKDILKNGAIQALLPLKMIIDRGDINVCCFGDPAYGGILETFLAKDNAG